MTTFVDDDGNTVTDPAKLSMAREAETALAIGAFRKEETGDASDIKIAEVIDILLERSNDRLVGDDLLDTFLSGLGKKIDDS